MHDRPSPTVIIVGAGPTGLAAANLLGQLAIPTLLLERNPSLCDIPRAITIDDEGLRICQYLGLYEELRPHLMLDVEAHYLASGRYLARVTPGKQSNGHPMISTFHQPTFEAILLQGVQRFPCVSIRFQHCVESVEQDERAIYLKVRTPDGSIQPMSCRYLLACDGGQSTIRHALHIPLRSVGLPGGRVGRRWLVVDCEDDEDATRAAVFYCDPARPTVTVPAPGRRRRWEFMLLPGENEQDLSAETRSLTASRQAVYTFHTAMAASFQQQNIFLLGDAAHLMPPFGGQGMNCGLCDAYNICWKLALVLQGHASPALLRTYEEERRPHTASMIRFSDLLGRLIMPTSRPLAWIRNLFFRALNLIPPARALLTKAGIKPRPHYRRGLLSSIYNEHGLSGQPLPQPSVRTHATTHTPLDDILGPGFSLLRLYEIPRDAFKGFSHHTLRDVLHLRFVCVLPPGSLQAHKEQEADGTGPACPHVVIDDSGFLTKFLRNRRDLYLLVRPDRYIAGACKVAHLGALLDDLASQLRQG